MPRMARAAVGESCYHVINRGNARQKVFLKQGDYQALIELIPRVCERIRMRVLAYCVMPNHFRLALPCAIRSQTDAELQEFRHNTLGNAVRFA
ncbi:MAG: transposase [Candidatus Binatia bacterium]